jgi:predicted HTH transcriptional regulator
MPEEEVPPTDESAPPVEMPAEVPVQVESVEEPQAESPAPPVATQTSSPLRPLNHQTAKELSMKAHVAVAEKKRLKRERIMGLFNKKTEIANDDVEKLLHVSDATAARYLSELVKEGRIMREGKGRFVRYRKIS